MSYAPCEKDGCWNKPWYPHSTDYCIEHIDSRPKKSEAVDIGVKMVKLILKVLRSHLSEEKVNAISKEILAKVKVEF